MKLKVGYSIQAISDNTKELLSAVDKTTAFSIAAALARGVYKQEHPDRLDFPEHLKPGKNLKEMLEVKEVADNGRESVRAT